MKSVFMVLVGLTGLVNSLLAQTPNQSLPPTVNPQIEVAIFSDGQSTTQQTGVKLATKEFRFRALLDKKSTDFFEDFQSRLLIKNTQILLTRNGRKLALKNTPDDPFLVNLTSLLKEAQPTDHIIFTFTLVAQRKNGELLALPEQPAYDFPIRE